MDGMYGMDAANAMSRFLNTALCLRSSCRPPVAYAPLAPPICVGEDGDDVDDGDGSSGIPTGVSVTSIGQYHQLLAKKTCGFTQLPASFPYYWYRLREEKNLSQSNTTWGWERRGGAEMQARSEGAPFTMFPGNRMGRCPRSRSPEVISPLSLLLRRG